MVSEHNGTKTTLIHMVSDIMVQKPYEFIWFVNMMVQRQNEFIWFLNIMVQNEYELT